MPKIRPISWKKFEKFLLGAGCKFTRQTSSHRIYWKEGISRPIVLPQYKDIPVFVIRNNLRILGIDQKEYLKILKNS